MTESTSVTEAEAGVVRRKACSACGGRFECCAGGCWCAGVSLSDAVRADLRERYGDCLCPACLARFAAETAAT